MALSTSPRLRALAWQNIPAIIQFGGGEQEVGTPALQGDQMNLLPRQDRARLFRPTSLDYIFKRCRVESVRKYLL